MVKKGNDTEEANKIKKPMSSYFHFMNERRTKFREDNPEMKMGQITQALTEVWKKLNDEERKKYEEMNLADKARYEKELETAG